MELELKTKDQTDFDYNRFFYATMCHVCKRFGDDVPLKRCSRCKLISYCGPQHQKQHWAQHKTLCKVVRDVLKDELKDGSERFDITMDEWDYLKVALMRAVIEKKGCLELYESMMFFYPKDCAICHDRNVESLIVCRNCALSFCKNHEDDIAHKDDCDALELCLRIYLSDMDNESILNMYLQHSFETTYTFLNMKDFINSYGKIKEGHSETSYDILAAGLSEHLTCSLTLLHAMRVLNVPKSKELVIHIVAASTFEECTLKMWEILLHVIMKIESLVIVIIISGLNIESLSLSICDNCLSRGKKISLEFYDGLYEDYVHSSSFRKPDFTVGFDADIQVEGITYIAEVKELSIKVLAEQNCPFLITNYTQEKLEESISRINTILSSKVDHIYSGENPFTSLRPNRCIRGRELVFYFNNFVAIYRSLCSKLM